MPSLPLRHPPRARPRLFTRHAVVVAVAAPSHSPQTASRIPHTGPAVAARAAGAPLLAVPQGGHRARLVTPGGAAPLAVDVDLFPVGSVVGTTHPATPATDAAVHTLVYVLGGAGTLTPATGGPPVPLRAGDCAAARGGGVLAPSDDAPPFDVGGVAHALAAVVVTLPSSAADADAVARVAASRVAGARRAGTLSAAAAAAACAAARVQRDDGAVLDSDDEDAVAETLAAAAPAAAVRHLADLPAFRMPAGTNRIALAFDPLRSGVPFCAGVEVFDPAHVTPQHVHATGYELFFVVAGAGVAHCDGFTFDLTVGDVAIFPPRSVHGLDAAPGAPLVCLEVMAPDDRFGEAVRSGTLTGRLTDSELCALAAVGCGGAEGEE